MSAADPSPADAGRHGEHPATVAEQIHDALRALPPAERRVARALLAVYPAAGLGTVAGLAEEASTSTATVVRLVQKLGYAGFPEFQERLLRELATRRSGPLERMEAAAPPGPDLLGSMAAQLGQVVASIASSVPRGELDAAVDLLSDPGRRVLLAGGRASHSLAELLGLHLGRLRPGVKVAPRDRVRRLLDVLDLAPRDVVLVVDLRRYESTNVELAARARERRARLIVITDNLLSPIARDAVVVLPVEVASPSPLDTMVAAMALIEVVALSAMHAIGPTARTRMEAWDELLTRETAT